MQRKPSSVSQQLKLTVEDVSRLTMTSPNESNSSVLNGQQRKHYAITAFLRQQSSEKFHIDGLPFCRGITLKDIPASKPTVVRIFVSSTFTDMQLERNALMLHAYPRLKEYCREEHGLEFQVIDMRWGVSDETTDNHMGPQMCMSEIQQCQRDSFGPNFLGLIGQRYGWVPLHRTIEKQEFETICSYLASQVRFTEQLQLLKTWYLEDTNSIPACYVLQPISSILQDYNNLNNSNAMAEARTQWVEVSGGMQRALEHAASALREQAVFTITQEKSYRMSVTHMEAQVGLFERTDASSQCLAYVRTLNEMQATDVWAISPYLDMRGLRVDPRYQDQLTNLRESVQFALPFANVKKFDVLFNEYVQMQATDLAGSRYLQNLIEDFDSKIKSLIKQAASSLKNTRDELTEEVCSHLRYTTELSKIFVGHYEVIESLRAYLADETARKPMIVSGQYGSGRTALIAKFHETIIAERTDQAVQHAFDLDHTHIIIRYLGSTSSSSTLMSFLSSVCYQLTRLGIRELEAAGPLPSKLVDLCYYFIRLINMVPDTEQVILLFDALENLDSHANRSMTLQWVPVVLPSNVKLVLTASETADRQGRPSVLRKLLRHQSGNELLVQVGGLTATEAVIMFKKLLENSRRTLTEEQWNIITSLFIESPLPLYVALLHRVASLWTSFDSGPALTKWPLTIEGCINLLLSLIEKRHGYTLVSHTIGYLTAARFGLSEMELEDLLSLDDEVLNEVYQWHIAPIRRLPVHSFAGLKNDLFSRVISLKNGATKVLNFCFQIYHDIARQRYVKDDKTAQEMHSRIADYFSGKWVNKAKPFRYKQEQLTRFRLEDREYEEDRLVAAQPYVFDKAGDVNFNMRKTVELPYNLIRAGRLQDALQECFFNFLFLYARVSTGGIQLLIEDIEDFPMYRDNPDLLILLNCLKLSASSVHANPNFLGFHLLGRLLPFYHSSVNINRLLQTCDTEGIRQCALVPVHHCLQTPGGPLQHSYEGSNVASYGVCVASESERIITGSNKIQLWRIDSGVKEQECVYKVRGVVLSLKISPDGSTFAGFSTDNQVFMATLATLNVVEPEAIRDFLQGLLEPARKVRCIELTNDNILLWTSSAFCRYSISQNAMIRSLNLASCVQDSVIDEVLINSKKPNQNELLVFASLDGNLKRYSVNEFVGGNTLVPKMQCHSACVFNSSLTRVYRCQSPDSFDIEIFSIGVGVQRVLRNRDAILSFSLSPDEQFAVATVQSGFNLWNLSEAIVDPYLLALPNTSNLRNFPIPLAASKQNLVVFSQKNAYMACAVRRYIFIYSLIKMHLIKSLDLHFERVLLLAANAKDDTFISSSLDRSIKIWDFKFITAQHYPRAKLDRCVEAIYTNDSGFALAITKYEMSLWNTNSGQLVKSIPQGENGCFVRAVLAENGQHAVALQEQALTAWRTNSWLQQWSHTFESNTVMELRVLSGDRLLYYRVTLDQSKVDEDKDKPAAAGGPHANNAMMVSSLKEQRYAMECIALETGIQLFKIEYEHYSKFGFVEPCCTAADSFLCVVNNKRDRGMIGDELLSVYSVSTGNHAYNTPLRYPGKREICRVSRINDTPNLVAFCDIEKAVLFNVVSKMPLYVVPHWLTGISSIDGQFGLSLTAEQGLQTIDLKTGKSLVKLLRADTSTSALTMHVRLAYHDQYVVFYSSESNAIRVFRLADGCLVAQAQFTATVMCLEVIEQKIIVGLRCGTVIIMLLVDADKPKMIEAISDLPSRCPRNRKFEVAVRSAQAVTRFRGLRVIENGVK